VLAWRAWKIRPGLASTSSWVAQCQWPGFLPFWLRARFLPRISFLFSRQELSSRPGGPSRSRKTTGTCTDRSMVSGDPFGTGHLLALARLSPTNQPKCHASSVLRWPQRRVSTQGYFFGTYVQMHQRVVKHGAPSVLVAGPNMCPIPSIVTRSEVSELRCQCPDVSRSGYVQTQLTPANS
jgi:hypothetical protein